MIDRFVIFSNTDSDRLQRRPSGRRHASTRGGLPPPRSGQRLLAVATASAPAATAPSSSSSQLHRTHTPPCLQAWSGES
eukprot:6192259-Pleurochrysis_carterae.AAC.1